MVLIRLQFVSRKVKAAIEGGLNVILCIGESLEVNIRREIFYLIEY